MKLLIAYDGSPDAKAAVSLAGHLFDGETAVILTVWEGFSEVMMRANSGFAVASIEFEEIDQISEANAHARAEEGVSHARAAGLAATPVTAESAGSIWTTILAEAQRADADMVIVGTRGLSPLKSLVMGSVSRGLVRHADRPVLVVPGAPATEARSDERGRTTAGRA